MRISIKTEYVFWISYKWRHCMPYTAFSFSLVNANVSHYRDIICLLFWTTLCTHTHYFKISTILHGSSSLFIWSLSLSIYIYIYKLDIPWSGINKVKEQINRIILNLKKCWLGCVTREHVNDKLKWKEINWNTTLRLISNTWEWFHALILFQYDIPPVRDLCICFVFCLLFFFF